LGIFLLLLPTLVRLVRAVRNSQVDGIGVDVGALAGRWTLLATLGLLGVISYWLSGKLVKA
jgi:hypothetical protein